MVWGVGHVNEHFCLFAAFITADSKGKWVVCGSEDNGIFLWDLNKKDVSRVAHAVTALHQTCNKVIR